MAGFAVFSISRKKNLTLTYLRTIQVGFFVCSALEIPPQHIFNTTVFKLSNFAVFAFTSGYLSSLASIKAPEVVKTAEERGNVGAFIGVAKCLGILIGSTLAVPMKEVIKLTPSYIEMKAV